ncbi:MAG: hypothetical protein V1734_05470 [Nanoarchaeota archaeon]
MKIQYILASAALLIAVLLTSMAISAPINTNITNATMEIELSKSSFAVNETITGVLRIPLNENLDAEQEIELRIQIPMKRVSQTKTLASALTNASFNFTQSEPLKEVSNPAATKTLSFSNNGEQSIAIQAGGYSEVQSIDMDMSGPDSNTLDNVRIDVGNDGIIDWYYLGTKNGWASEFTKPEGISETSAPSILIWDNNSMYCQVMNLPFAKDFQISAQYQKKNSAGNITAALIDIDGFDEPPINMIATNMFECDLPENTDMAWGSCEISGIEYGFHDKYLFCVYSTNGTGTELYDLKATAPPSTTAHKCYRAGDKAGECEELTSKNPQIKIKQATYTKTFKGNIEFTAWDYSPDAVKKAIEDSTNEYAPPGICGDFYCTIELKFIANKSGTISLSNLNFEYISEDTLSRVTEFYDIESSSAYIGSITKGASSIDLPANATIEIPLEAFGLKVPQTVVSGTNVGIIEVRFAGKSVNATIAIGGEGIAANPSTAPGMIEETRAALTALNALTGDARLALKILHIDEDITAAISELGNLSARASADTPALRAEITSFREKLPKEVILGSSIKDFQLIEPNDITTDIAPAANKESTYYFQEKAQIKASVTTVSIKNFAGATAKYALVKKEITAKSAIAKFDIYEVIEKSVADSTSDIFFETTPSAIVKSDPIVKWFVSSGLATGAKTEQRYMVKSEFDVPMDRVKTILVPSEEIGEPSAEPDSVCGDGICTDYYEDATICPEDCTSKTPWGIIISIIIMALLLGLYLGFYKGKYSLWNLTKKKKPFTSKSDLESVKSFIRTSRGKGLDDSVTKSRLHEKGWSEEQIKFAFGEMEWEKKEKSVEKPSENTSPVKEYIKTALSRGMTKEKIKGNLVAKGWKKEDVEKELEKK